MNEDLQRRLRQLDEEYTVAVNTAIDEDRDDLIRHLVAEYPEARREVLLADAA